MYNAIEIRLHEKKKDGCESVLTQSRQLLHSDVLLSVTHMNTSRRTICCFWKQEMGTNILSIIESIFAFAKKINEYFKVQVVCEFTAESVTCHVNRHLDEIHTNVIIDVKKGVLDTCNCTLLHYPYNQDIKLGCTQSSIENGFTTYKTSMTIVSYIEGHTPVGVTEPVYIPIPRLLYSKLNGVLNGFGLTLMGGRL